MEPLYNIYYAGEVLEGQDASSVRSRLASLFKASDATLDSLFSGKPQLIKSGCDKAAALKYKQAMEKAGARPLIKAAAGTTAAPQTAAERIAALAAAPDVVYGSAAREPATARQSEAETDSAAGIQLAPAGTATLRPEERSAPLVREVDTAGLEASGGYERLAAVSPPPPPGPDTSHLSLGEAGDIPHLPPDQEPLAPDTDGLQLSPAGTDFTDCAAPAATPLQLDLSAIEMAPEGSDMLEARYRRKDEAASPATDHLSIQE